MNPYRNYISELEALTLGAMGRPQSRPRRLKAAKARAGAASALIFSPHPDDECIIGGLALRLQRQAGLRVVNVAVTLGSKPQRRKARLQELKNACDHLGFDLVVAGGRGLEDVNEKTRQWHPLRWNAAVKVIAELLERHQPRVIFLPHEFDRHPTHTGTHYLVMDALRRLPTKFHCVVVETEFWGQMAEPNLLVEIGSDELADMMAALSLHTGEVKRNPYHLRLPAWMMDNVRRVEIVSGEGRRAPDFTFGTIYRLRKWKGGRLAESPSRGKFLASKTNPALLLR